MDDVRRQLAEVAIRTVDESYRTIGAAEVAEHERGHSFHRGMHIGWAWGETGPGRPYLDFLSEHRHPGIAADRYFADGRIEPIDVPASGRAISPDPTEDAEWERRFVERNRATYAALRDRGLLPPAGSNLMSQEVNEYLSTSRDPDAPAAPAQLFGGGWDEILEEETAKPYWSHLQDFLTTERASRQVLPPAAQTFRAFGLTPYSEVKVVILGQDPYPNPGEAHGLAFSVPSGSAKKPPSLRNIHKVLETDLSQALGREVTAPDHGSLEGWAEQGVLLLNTALTVRAGTKKDRAAHRRWQWEGQSWGTFTDAVIRAVAAKPDPVVFLHWGKDAQRKTQLIDTERHLVIESSHPSPYSARLGFLASRPFSEANAWLAPSGRAIDWERAGSQGPIPGRST